MVSKDFLLPDLGEGLTESELIEWHVAVGDIVTLNQPLAEVETAKAIVSLPSPFAGRIAKLYAEPGTTVAVGSPIVAFELNGSTARSADAAPTTDTRIEDAAATAPERTAVLVGYGPAVESGSRPKRKARRDTSPLERRAGETVAASTHTISTPPVRRLAHHLGVDLTGITGSGADGLITREDVLAAVASGDVIEHATPTKESATAGREPARETMAPTRAAGAAGAGGSGSGERRIPIKGVRKATAAAMVASAFSAPHATVFLTVDVTRTLELVAAVKARGEAASLLAVVAKALCLAVARNPSVNSHWDEAAGEVVEYDAVNLGIAVATPRGLVVPNIRGAQAMPLGALTRAIGELSTTARDGATSPAALSGGTITISNVGVFGVDAGTPILNPGEAAILAVGAVRRMPWEHRGELALRDVMTLSLSFDHRLVDGEQGARFLADIGAVLTEPGMVLAY
jgi:2-oxoisovalerate dehydrogenase E2 component (dihydrolipoyl transacylase)